MDAYEATRIVFSRIQSLDPENASKIMGLLLIQDHGEKEMIRLAFGPETLLQSLVIKARNDLGLSSNTPSTPSTPSSPSPFSNPISISRQNSSSSFPLPPSRMNNNNLTSSSLSINSSSWAPSTFSDELISPNSNSYSTINGFSNGMIVGGGGGAGGSVSDGLIDEFQLQDQLSFLNDGPKNNSDFFYQPQPESVTSPNNGTNQDMLFPSYSANWGMNNNNNNNGSHRRSISVTDACFNGGGLSDPWKPCLYYARGYCKNGTACRFLHDFSGADTAASGGLVIGSPNNNNKLESMEQQCQEFLLRTSKTQQQQQQQQQNQLRLSTASQLMASAAAFPYTASASTASKCMNFLLQQQQQNENQRAAAAAALMLGEDVHSKLGRVRIERNDFSSSCGGGIVNPGSRQIYLTFPADSTFREEDVSNYFSIYGPVQDVRIPYQQKRMFGFVTFVYPETVKLILAKGNPHFVCDARVLVKPYKEKGKITDKKQQQLERGEFSACSTPTGLDSRDHYNLQLGARMFNNTQDVLLRRKLEEQADLQQAIELQGRRFMGLQLLDVKKHHHRNLSAGAALNIPSPTQLHSPYMFNHSLIPPSPFSDRSSPEFPEEFNCGSPATTNEQQFQRQVNAANNKEEYYGDDSNGSGSDSKESPKLEDSNFHDSLEHNLPDSPFASPIKSGGNPSSFFTTSSAEAALPVGSSSSSSSIIASSTILPATSTLDMASLKSCFFQIPRFSSGPGAIGM